MKLRYDLIAPGIVALGLSMAGCGDYSDRTPASGGGSGATGGTSNAGTTPGGSSGATGGGTSGAGGSTGGTPAAGGTTAGSAGNDAGTGGSAAGTGGSTAGTGGSTAGAGGGGSGDAGGGGTSGGGEPVTCDPLEPCGGAVLGTYTVVDCPLTITGEVNVRSLGLSPTCEQSPSPVSGTATVVGTWIAMDDGTFEDETTTTGEATFELAPPCLELSGTTTTCAQIAGPLASLGFRTLACEDNTETGGCTCMGTIEQDGGLGFVDVNAETRGSFTTMDSTLVTSAFGNEAEYSYCTAENKLALTLVTMSRTGTLTGPIVLQQN